MSNSKTILNFYWSLRRFIWGNFPLVTVYYSPETRPSATPDKYLMVRFGQHYGGKLNHAYATIFCVAKNDPEGQKLMELVSVVVDKFSSPGSGLKSFPFYNQATGLAIGRVDIISVDTKMTIPFAEGYVEKSVEVEMRYVAEDVHL